MDNRTLQFEQSEINFDCGSAHYDLKRIVDAMTKGLRTISEELQGKFIKPAAKGPALRISLVPWYQEVLNALKRRPQERLPKPTDFIVNAKLSNLSGEVRLGGFVTGSDSDYITKCLDQQITIIRNAIQEELKRQGVSASDLVDSNFLDVLGINVSEWGHTKLKTICIAPRASGNKLLGRMLVGAEFFDGTSIKDALRETMQKIIKDAGGFEDEEDQEDFVERFSENIEQPDSRLWKLCRFLEGEGLSRIRLKISIDLLNRIVKCIENLKPNQERIELEKYAQKIIEFYETFSGDADPDLAKATLPIKAFSRTSTTFAIRDIAVQSQFYGWLPIFALAEPQIIQVSAGDRTIRGFTMRWKTNGPVFRETDVSDTAPSVFEYQAEKSIEILKSALANLYLSDNSAPKPQRGDSDIAKAVTVLILLTYICTDKHIKLNTHIEKWKTYLTNMENDDPKNIHTKLEQLYTNLVEKGKSNVDAAAQGLRNIMRLRQSVFPDQQKEAYTYFMGLQTDAFAPEKSRTLNPEELIRKSTDTNSDHLLWLQNLVVSQHKLGNRMERCPFLVKVRVDLKEYFLEENQNDEKMDVKMRSEPVLPVLVAPAYKDSDSPKRIKHGAFCKNIGVGLGPSERKMDRWRVMIGYPVLHSVKNADKDQEEPIRSLVIGMTTFLVLIAIRQMVRAESVPDNIKNFRTIMLKLMCDDEKSSDQQKENTPGEPTDAFYAVFNSLEHIFAEYQKLNGQGVTERTLQPPKVPKYISDNVRAGLIKSYPLELRPGPHKDLDDGAMALMTIYARPSDTGNMGEKLQYVRTIRTHVGRKQDGVFVVDRGVHGTDLFSTLQTHDRQIGAIRKVIGKLYDDGYRHIIVLSVQFDAKQLFRRDQRLFNQKEIWNLLQHFQDLHVYPMTLERYSVCNLLKEIPSPTRPPDNTLPDGFELLNNQESGIHQLINATIQGAKQELTPIYAFATFRIVSPKDHPRYQSGIMGYMLHSPPNLPDDQITRGRIIRDIGTILNPHSPVYDHFRNLVRGVHILESGHAIKKRDKSSVFLPILHPLPEVSQANPAKTGEFLINQSRSQKRKIYISFTALLHHLSSRMEAATKSL